jgi:hypothetical protein
MNDIAKTPPDQVPDVRAEQVWINLIQLLLKFSDDGAVELAQGTTLETVMDVLTQAVTYIRTYSVQIFCKTESKRTESLCILAETAW